MVLFRGDIKCKSLQRRTSLSVILPADNIHYLQSTEEIVEKPYKTLYLLHGLFGSDDIFLANPTKNSSPCSISKGKNKTNNALLENK